MYEWSDCQWTENIMMTDTDVFPAFMKQSIVTEKCKWQRDSKQMNTSIICTYIMWHGGKGRSAINENNGIHLGISGKEDHEQFSEEMSVKLKYEQTLAKERKVYDMRQSPSHRKNRMCKGTGVGKRSWKRLVTKLKWNSGCQGLGARGLAAKRCKGIS